MGVVPGRLESDKAIPLINPVGLEFHSPVDHIELTAAEATLNLSELVRTIEQFSFEFTSARDKAIRVCVHGPDELIQINLESGE